MTVECPDELRVPIDTVDLHGCKDYWMLTASTVFHQKIQKTVEFNVQNLDVGDTIGCSIHEDGTLHYYVNGKDTGVCWDDKLPVNLVVYGCIDVFGHVTKIRSLFHYSKYKCMLTKLLYPYWLLI